MRFIACIALASALGLPSTGRAQTGGEATPPTANDELSLDESRRASALFDSTMSPFCPGRTLNSCPSGKATAWRQDIRAWVAEGLSNDEILARLQARVPDFQLEGTPPTDWSWAGPLVVMALLTAAFALGGLRTIRARREAATRTEAAPATPPTDRSPEDPDRKLLERELEQLE
jgi:cytochrome c-type biogenesis protein CcmH/NrfF